VIVSVSHSINQESLPALATLHRVYALGDYLEVSLILYK
jgi:hypothetical protein